MRNMLLHTQPGSAELLLFFQTFTFFFFLFWYILLKMLRARPISQAAHSVCRARLSAFRGLPVPYIGAGRRMASTVS